MTQQESHDHHYVPEFLLRPWASNKGLLKGYYWNSWKNRLDCKERGVNGFCYKRDLLTLTEHNEGRDVLERKFFGEIDSTGADARDQLLDDGPESLDNGQRCDFARLLLSLEARRPATVQKLRDGGSYLAEAVDSDQKILHAMETEGLSGTPSENLTSRGFSFEDRALSNIQRLVDNPEIAVKLLNLHWRVVRLGPGDGTLVLSDRPLVRLFAYDHPKASWFLPLAPKIVFFAANCPQDFERLTPQKFAKLLNFDSVKQAQKYVFCVDTSHNRLLKKYLPSRDGA